MKVRYIATSHVCISVQLSSGGSQHIAFTPKTSGGSFFYTENEEIQKALERHPRYGKLFKKDLAFNIPNAKVAKGVNQKKKTSEATKTQEIPVSDLGKAREYLATRYGIARGKIRSKAQILECAEKNGIKFIGLE